MVRNVVIGVVAEGHFSTEAHDHREKRGLAGEWVEARGGPCCRCRSNIAAHRVEGEFMSQCNNTSRTGKDASISPRGPEFNFLYPSTGHNYTCQISQMWYSWTRDPQGTVYFQTLVTIDLMRTSLIAGQLPAPYYTLPQYAQYVRLLTKYDKGLSWIKHTHPEAWAADIQNEMLLVRRPLLRSVGPTHGFARLLGPLWPRATDR